jgi:hyaluronate lyase
VVKLKALMANKSIAPLPEPNQTTIFSTQAKAVALRPNWGVGISYYSPRVFNYEDAGENRRGWHQADGMVYLNNADADQFNGDFWPTVDSTRLPGTTETKGATGGSNRPNEDIFAGGANLNQYFGAVGFTFKPGNEQSLIANKGWFTFDDEVVCLGSSITGTGGKEIETVIENRKLKIDGTNALIIDGKSQPINRPWNIKAVGTHWMHLAGSVPGSDIGYYFPTPTDLDLIREQRSDSWRSIHVLGSERSVTDSFLTATTSHGTDPKDANYAYVLLPNRDAGSVAKYAAKPGVAVLMNTPDISAVRENSLGVVEALFWKDESASLDLLKGKSVSSDKKAAIVIREAKKQMEIAVSDPTQVNEGAINLEFSRPMKSVLSADSNITVVQRTPTLKLRIDVKGAKGKSFQAKFLALK